MQVIDRFHEHRVHDRRVRVLAGALARLLPERARVVDVGCGDGLLSRLIERTRPDVTVEGIDVLVRPGAHVPVRAFDGRRLPYADDAVDAVLFVDVLHHTEDPAVLLREARRVARRCVLLKDHTTTGILATPTLRLMDHVGNTRHGVAIPANYWPAQRWREAFDQLRLEVTHWTQDVPLYPWWASWAFGRSLHFIASLTKRAA